MNEVKHAVAFPSCRHLAQVAGALWILLWTQGLQACQAVLASILTQHGRFQLVSLGLALPFCCIDIWICKLWALPSLAVCLQVGSAGVVFGTLAHHVVGACFFTWRFQRLGGPALCCSKCGRA